jgi:HK97 family phage prohead protease
MTPDLYPELDPAAIRRLFPMPMLERAQNERSDDYTLRGHAADFNSLSEDLGGFREIIEPGAFRAALRRQPDVRLLFNHNPDYVMARTASDTLELREDSQGLHVWARLAPLAWVSDLRTSMQRGDIDQMSFAFTLREERGDDWVVAEDGTVIRTIRADGVDELFDVSVVTYPAYIHTNAVMRGITDLRSAVENGRLPASVLGEPGSAEATAGESPAGETAPRTTGGGVSRRLAVAKRRARVARDRTPPVSKDD